MLSNKVKLISFALLLLPVMVFIQRTFFLPDGTPGSLNGPHALLVAQIFCIIGDFRRPMYNLEKSLNRRILGAWTFALVSVYLAWFIFYSTNVFATQVTMAYFLYLWAVFPIAVGPYFEKKYPLQKESA